MATRGVIVLLSGGMDSATLLAEAVEDFSFVQALSVDYDQRHKKELEYAQDLAAYYHVPHEILDISNINRLISSSALTNRLVSVPHGHYEDESMKVTVVPGRNTIMLSIAAGMAASKGWSHVGAAVHAGDHAIYCDCRPEYIKALQDVFYLFDYNKVTIWTPFLHIDKGDILTRGLRLRVPYELTWTCYEGKEKACGRCGACTERRDAFSKNNVKDPIQYED